MLTLIAVAAVSLSANAQQQSDKPRTQPTAEDIAQKRTEMMVKEYGLNNKQAEKLFELNKAYAEKQVKRAPKGPRHDGKPGNFSKKPGKAEHKQGRPVDGTTAATPQSAQQNDGAKAQRPDSVKKGPRPEFGRRPNGPKHIKDNGIYGPDYRKQLKKILTKKQYTKYLENELKHLKK